MDHLRSLLHVVLGISLLILFSLWTPALGGPCTEGHFFSEVDFDCYECSPCIPDDRPQQDCLAWGLQPSQACHPRPKTESLTGNEASGVPAWKLAIIVLGVGVTLALAITVLGYLVKKKRIQWIKMKPGCVSENRNNVKIEMTVYAPQVSNHYTTNNDPKAPESGESASQHSSQAGSEALSVEDTGPLGYNDLKGSTESS